MKIRLFTFLACSLAATVGFGQLAETQRPSNAIVAQVENKIITVSDLKREMDVLVPQIRAESVSPYDFRQRLLKTQEQVVNELIDRLLIVAAFEEEGFQIPEQHLERVFKDRLIEEFNNDRAEFLAYLKSIGLNEIEFRQKLREDIIVSSMSQQHAGNRAAVSPEEVLSIYESEENRSQFWQDEGIKLRVISLRPQDGESPEERSARAQTLAETLRNRGPVLRSEAIMSDFGWIKRDDKRLRPEVAEAVFAMEPGHVSDPIPTDDTYIVAMVLDKREAGKQELSSVRADIEQAIATKLTQEARARWISRLREKYYWNVFSWEGPIVYGGPDDGETVRMRIGQGGEETSLPN